jgi:hypothetical protein
MASQHRAQRHQAGLMPDGRSVIALPGNDFGLLLARSRFAVDCVQRSNRDLFSFKKNPRFQDDYILSLSAAHLIMHIRFLGRES